MVSELQHLRSIAHSDAGDVSTESVLQHEEAFARDPRVCVQSGTRRAHELRVCRQREMRLQRHQHRGLVYNDDVVVVEIAGVASG